MKTLVRLFFRGLRIVLGPFMLLWEYLGRPRPLVRSPERQRQVEQACQGLTLYQFRTCPFCIKVRHERHRLALPLRCVDAQHDAVHRAALLQGGGELKVPCLRIADAMGTEQWLYESGAIIAYLRERFDDTARN